ALKEIKARVEDALNATKAAAQEGIVVGGGVALLRASSALDGLQNEQPDVHTGVRLIRDALTEPLRRIAQNAGRDGAVVVRKVEERKGKKVNKPAIGECED